MLDILQWRALLSAVVYVGCCNGTVHVFIFSSLRSWTCWWESCWRWRSLILRTCPRLTCSTRSLSTTSPRTECQVQIRHDSPPPPKKKKTWIAHMFVFKSDRKWLIVWFLSFRKCLRGIRRLPPDAHHQCHDGVRSHHCKSTLFLNTAFLFCLVFFGFFSFLFFPVVLRRGLATVMCKCSLGTFDTRNLFPSVIIP